MMRDGLLKLEAAFKIELSFVRICFLRIFVCFSLAFGPDSTKA
jgi:hypothetical protein